MDIYSIRDRLAARRERPVDSTMVRPEKNSCSTTASACAGHRTASERVAYLHHTRCNATISRQSASVGATMVTGIKMPLTYAPLCQRRKRAIVSHETRSDLLCGLLEANHENDSSLLNSHPTYECMASSRCWSQAKVRESRR